MALDTPTTQEISDTIVAQISASISQSIPLLPIGFTRILAKILAAVFILLFKYIGWNFLQIFVRTASFQETIVLGQTLTPLIEWGRLIGIGDPNPSTPAELVVDIEVINQVGSLLAGTQLTSNKNGVTYLLLSPVTLDAATVQGTIRASTDIEGNTAVGAAGNLDPADIVSFVQPLDNVERDTVVDSTSVIGVDGEVEEDYRQRVIDRFQKLAQGGSGVDYTIWGIIAGIVNIYPYKGTPGFVDVYAEANTDLDPDGIPTSAQLLAIADAITFDDDGLQTRKPVNAKLNVYAITRKGYTITITGLTVDDPVTVKANIDAAITAYFLDREPFIDGVTTLPRRDFIKVSNVNSIVDDFVSAAGGSFTSTAIEITIGAVPVPVQDQLGIGEKAKADAINYV
jgi:uncharacterized phage protein gp47/JayE